MTNCRELLGLVLFVGTLLLAAAWTTPAEQANVISFLPSPEPEFDRPLSSKYFFQSPESDSPAPDSLETEPESLSPLYPPEVFPSPVVATGSPPEPSFESGPAPEFPPVLSPIPETELADSDSSNPSLPPPLPSMAPITGDDNDAEPSYEPTPSSWAFDQSNSNGDGQAMENYSDQDGTVYNSPENRESKGGSGVVFGVVAGVCFVGLGGFVYFKRRENGMERRSKYDQYLELSKREGV
ncbi:proline-rich receptor-like protein kinase PERK13 [Punica granatum]|uniref:Uncharacterized protein n=2 Tax=Punica granatum TaxID=22663 RepID=A0A218XBT2_PUNGR|nr:proline-rich receptor-like protein kinase PERK13 [Punica granatum]OWM82403.1 hypothetical protein CDL15_Pgr001977 [Punica granatum]PKI65164.1 hypothetical protein CRG98_014478 [Punica granatum]